MHIEVVLGFNWLTHRNCSAVIAPASGQNPYAWQFPQQRCSQPLILMHVLLYVQAGVTGLALSMTTADLVFSCGSDGVMKCWDLRARKVQCAELPPSSQLQAEVSYAAGLQALMLLDTHTVFTHQHAGSLVCNVQTAVYSPISQT